MLKEASVADLYYRVLTAIEISENKTGPPLVLKNQTQNNGKSTQNASDVDEAFDQYMAYVKIQKPMIVSLIQQRDNAQQFKEIKYEAKELLASHTYDPGWNKQTNSAKAINQGQ